jgi:hypothetical protein
MENVVTALRFCWAALGAPTGKRLVSVIAVLVPTLRALRGARHLLSIHDVADKSVWPS